MTPRWSLRTRQRNIFIVAVVLGLLSLTAGGVAFANLLGARERLVNRVDPAAVTARDLDNAMLDQETGVRGFALTGDESFLEPYARGTATAAQASDRLASLLRRSEGLLAQAADTTRLANAWHLQAAEPEVARVRIQGSGTLSEAFLVAGNDGFEAFRTSFGRLESALGAARSDARHDLDVATGLLVAALVILMATAIGIAVFVRRALTRWTLEPLDRLAVGTRAVAAGDLHFALQPDGPVEIAALGADVEAMRRRIVQQVVDANAARDQLDEYARELARSNQDLEQFAYVASHDLQEPLRKVTSFCQLLQRRYEGRLDDRADQYIEFAVDGARRMQRLINDLLVFSRVGRTTEAFVDVDCNDVVRRVRADLDTVIDETDARFDVGELPVVRGDATLITLLFRNLVSNAIKFRSDEPPMISVRAERAADGEHGDLWQFCVADNGIGIEPEYAEKVFVIFQRLHSRDEYPGTGIGLALAKRIVEFHGGSIRLDTGRTRGAAVLFTLPTAARAS